MKAFSTLRIEKLGNHVGELVLSRPAKLNAMSPAFFAELEEAAQVMAVASRLKSLP
jgi:enoyl-CoA hydratase/carnithine racemase